MRPAKLSTTLWHARYMKMWRAEGKRATAASATGKPPALGLKDRRVACAQPGMPFCSRAAIISRATHVRKTRWTLGWGSGPLTSRRSSQCGSERLTAPAAESALCIKVEPHRPVFHTKERASSPVANWAQVPAAKASAEARLATATREPSSTSLRIPRSMKASAFHSLMRAAAGSSRKTTKGVSAAGCSMEYNTNGLSAAKSSAKSISPIGSAATVR
mmetsp:Transcript_6464/g.15311  ORF Transcript_6464/g.15311 Transcript_6464/m.15311 type:complete len:217 (+) Transcript_6464:622-1272(+)